MPLTDVKIRQAKAGDKPTKLTDANGLYLEVRPSGSKLWRYRYRIAGKENLFAIGEYPAVSPRVLSACRAPFLKKCALCQPAHPHSWAPTWAYKTTFIAFSEIKSSIPKRTETHP
ncbi:MULTISPECIES: Arm DNA-binding domain-containing protein [Burkholderia]|uniref:Arm DNA-binding domain-containing protein n=1 Tax=Burkholderia TaxID=32008 RepID=UPI001EF6EF75|nr:MULTISPECIES: Arm DNA-binding domain-containing protein [Burkholderia]